MEEEEDEVDTWAVEEVVALVEVEAGEADEAVVEEVRFFDYFRSVFWYLKLSCILLITCLILTHSIQISP